MWKHLKSLWHSIRPDAQQKSPSLDLQPDLPHAPPETSPLIHITVSNNVLNCNESGHYKSYSVKGFLVLHAKRWQIWFLK